MALDYFDASVNRIAAWVTGLRNVQKAQPFGEIWAEYCRRSGVSEDGAWLPEVRRYLRSLNRIIMPADKKHFDQDGTNRQCIIYGR